MTRHSAFDDDTTRLILFHKHPMSARMHFLYFKYDDRHGGVCAFKPLPKLAAPVEMPNRGSDFVLHPAAVKAWGEQQLGLRSVSLQMEPEFCEYVEVPNGEITVYLAGFEGYELPTFGIQQHDARFISLMECIGIAPVEMLLLQRAYGVIMGGQS
jgi:hypothetical protein